jgi:hypothetical protein
VTGVPAQKIVRDGHSQESGGQSASASVDFWYGIPHGYHLVDLQPSEGKLRALVSQLSEVPGELREQADKVLRFYAHFALALLRHHVCACLIGMHPSEKGDPSFSVLTVSSLPVYGVNAELAVARMAGVGSSERSAEGIVPVRLPCGTGFLAERYARSAAPGRSRAGDVYQATVAVAHQDRESVIMLQMITPAVQQAVIYRDIVVGVAHTLTFDDPKTTHGGSAESGHTELPERSVAEAMRNEFG